MAKQPVDFEDTIAAIASAAGGAMRGIVRVTGSGTLSCVTRVFASTGGSRLSAIHQPSTIAGAVTLPLPLGRIPCDLYVWPSRRSYTRQPAAELHTLGSAPLLEAILHALCQQGARPARPGEFTMRAFLAGRLDLTQAEAVLGVIDAHDRSHLQVALRQLAGGVGRHLQTLRDQLLDLLAHLEAGLDFVEEDNLFLSAEQLESQLTAAAGAVTRLAEQYAARGDTSAGLRIVILGWPNVGKSSLLNALTGETAAIVSHQAGTTRDYVTCSTRIRGLACQLIDTAGVDHSRDTLSRVAQGLGAEQLRQAHLQLLCLDSTRRLNDWERCVLQDLPSIPRVLVLTKTDGRRSTDLHLPAVETSARTGVGLVHLERRIYSELVEGMTCEGVVASTAVRCCDSLRRAGECLQQAIEAARFAAGDEIVAAELRGALDELGQIVGAVYTDDILDRIFSRFCIGK